MKNDAGIAKNHCQDIVKVVRDAAGQETNGFHLVRLTQLSRQLTFLQFRLLTCLYQLNLSRLLFAYCFSGRAIKCGHNQQERDPEKMPFGKSVGAYIHRHSINGTKKDRESEHLFQVWTEPCQEDDQEEDNK